MDPRINFVAVRCGYVCWACNSPHFSLPLENNENHKMEILKSQAIFMPPRMINFYDSAHHLVSISMDSLWMMILGFLRLTIVRLRCFWSSCSCDRGAFPRGCFIEGLYIKAILKRQPMEAQSTKSNLDGASTHSQSMISHFENANFHSNGDCVN